MSHENLTLRRVEYKYSTFVPRFAAGIVDGLVFWLFARLISLVYVNTTNVSLQVLLYISYSSAFLIYSIWMHGKYGQTLGKMFCKVIVLDVSERPLSMKQAVLRDILSVILLPIDLAIGIPRIIHGTDYQTPHPGTIQWVILYSTSLFFILELVTMFTNQKRRALHDFIAGSVVIRKTNPLPELAA